jgi:hypothetical protein
MKPHQKPRDYSTEATIIITDLCMTLAAAGIIWLVYLLT